MEVKAEEAKKASGSRVCGLDEFVCPAHGGHIITKSDKMRKLKATQFIFRMRNVITAPASSRTLINNLPVGLSQVQRFCQT